MNIKEKISKFLSSPKILGGANLPKKSPDLDSFNIEVEQKQRQIYVLIKCKDPLDALDLAHAVMFSETMKPLKASWKVLP